MALRLSLKSISKGIKKLGKAVSKIQPGKVLQKVAPFVPGGTTISNLVSSGIDAVKGRMAKDKVGPVEAAANEYGDMKGSLVNASNNTQMVMFAAIAVVVILLLKR